MAQLLAGFEPTEVDVDGIRITGRMAGSGSPVLLPHGYPQTHVMWHRVAPILAEHHTVVLADPRGYGGSTKPPAGSDHAEHSKRAMAADQVAVMGACVSTASPRSGTIAAQPPAFRSGCRRPSTWTTTRPASPPAIESPARRHPRPRRQT
jgi:hypothetical protein